MNKFFLLKDNLANLDSFQHLVILLGVDSLASDILNNIPNLEILRLDNLTHPIPDNFFRYCSKLRSLEIINSDLVILRNKQFYGLTNLTHLKLKIDPNVIFEDGFSFDYLISLKSLSISHDNLNILPPKSFRNLSNLQSITVFCECDYLDILYD